MPISKDHMQELLVALRNRNSVMDYYDFCKRLGRNPEDDDSKYFWKKWNEATSVVVFTSEQLEKILAEN